MGLPDREEGLQLCAESELSRGLQSTAGDADAFDLTS